MNIGIMISLIVLCLIVMHRVTLPARRTATWKKFRHIKLKHDIRTQNAIATNDAVYLLWARRQRDEAIGRVYRWR